MRICTTVSFNKDQNQGVLKKLSTSWIKMTPSQTMNHLKQNSDSRSKFKNPVPEIAPQNTSSIPDSFPTKYLLVITNSNPELQNTEPKLSLSLRQWRVWQLSRAPTVVARPTAGTGEFQPYCTRHKVGPTQGAKVGSNSVCSEVIIGHIKRCQRTHRKQFRFWRPFVNCSYKQC